MRAVKHAWAVMRAVAIVTYKEWAAYRSHVLVSLFVGPVFFLAQVFIWRAVFAGRETLNGLTLEQMLVYFGVSTLINYLVMDFADWNLQMLIHTGRFLTFLLRPVSHRYFALSQKVGHRLLGFGLEFAPVYFLFFFVFDIRLWPAEPVWAIISILLSFLMLFLVNYCVGITAFWLTRSGGVRGLFLLAQSICAGAFIPLTFFPVPLQKVLFVLPFQFITYVPVRVFLGSYELAGVTLSLPQVVGLQASAVLGMWGVSEILWRLGLRKFTAVGT